MIETCAISAEIQIKFQFAGLAPGEFESEYLIFDIEYSYNDKTKEINFLSAEVKDKQGIKLSQDDIDEYAMNWLDSDKGYIRAKENAEWR